MHVGLIITKIITMVIGFLIAFQAYRGYRRNDSSPMLYLAIGFMFISFGAVIEGILFEVVGLSPFDAGAIQTTIVGIGMIIILYSLYGNGTLMNL